MTHTPYPQMSDMPEGMPGGGDMPSMDDLAAQLGGGGFDMGGFLAQAQAMQAQFEAAQAELAVKEIRGSAGGDLVEVTISGNGDIQAVSIKPEACDPEDTESLEDLIVAAFRDAQERAQAVAEAMMGPLAGEFGQ